MRSLMPLMMTATTRPPRTASMTRPWPPKSEVPPMTAAPTASSRVLPAPAFDCTDCSSEAATTPETAAMPEQMRNTEIRMPDTTTPARRAASWLPPTAYTCRPYLVRLRTKCHTAKRITRRTTTHGMPSAVLLKNALVDRLRLTPISYVNAAPSAATTTTFAAITVNGGCERPERRRPSASFNLIAAYPMTNS